MTPQEVCIGCNMISGIGAVRFKKLCEFAGDIVRIPRLTRAELIQIPGFGLMLAEAVVAFDWDAEVGREIAIAEKGGVRILTLFDESYPDVLRTLYDPPLCLYVRGNLPEFPGNAIAVVGSRRISRYGEDMAVMLTEGAVRAGCPVVSGLAMGIDTIAHRTAVENCGITVGVIAGGLMHLYPKENIRLARQIIEGGGAVVSEFPFGLPVARQNFPRRNRIVAGLSRGTLVVEAGVESGALITARLALEYGRDVFAVPGRVDNPQSRGCHSLIKEGAALVESFDDITNAWNMGLLPGFPVPESDGSGDIYSDLSKDEAAVCRLLEESEASFDQLYELSGIEPGILNSVLMRLELKLLITQDAGNIYRLTRKVKQ